MRLLGRTLGIAGALSLAALFSACGAGNNCRGSNCPPSNRDGGIPGQGFAIDPPTATMTVDKAGMSIQFAAYYNGTDVTTDGRVVWTSGDPKMGTITPGGLFAPIYPLPHGGNVNITVQFKTFSAVATVMLNYVSPGVIGPGAPGDAADWWAAGPSQDPTEMPVIVYPFDGAMLPRNINQMNIQWEGAARDKLFRIHVTGPTIESNFYIGQDACKPAGQKIQCQFQPTEDQWRTVTLSSSGAPVQITVAGTTNRNQPVAETAPLAVNISPEDVRGGLYYFSPSINGLKRLPFGATQATNFVSFPPGSNNCAGCHAVSRDGKKVAATFYGGDGIGGAVAGDNGKKYLVSPAPGGGNAVKRWNFATFSPDNSLLLTNWAGVLTLRDGTTGAKKYDIPNTVTEGRAVMPEWSADSRRIVFVQLPNDGKLGKDLSPGNLVAGDWICGNTGNIATLDFDEQTKDFKNLQVIVQSTPQSEYHYYPSWSPDSEWILFVTAKWQGSSQTAQLNLFGANTSGYAMTYDQDTARLRLVRAEPGSPVIELTNATHQLNKTSSWPKFAPFLQANNTLVFITFSAKFNYGWVVTDGKTPQLWMSAIDLQRAQSELGAADPSFPPFWLPFQDPVEKNHSGIWTSDIACSTDVDCPDAEFSCKDGVCTPIIPG